MTDEKHVPEHEPMGLVGDNVGVPIPVLDEVGRGGDVVDPGAGTEDVAARSVDADATHG